MRTETTTRTLYKFDELSDSAKEHALQKQAEFVSQDGFWHECAIDDFKEIAQVIGIEIDNIYWSGFWSQGDGACFTGSYSYAKGAAKKIATEWLKDDELQRIARELQEVQSKYFYQLSASVAHRGHYSHEMCTQIDVYRDGDYADAETADTVTELLRDYMRWIYKRLETEFEYQTSEEVCKESIEANEYEFDENGDLA